MARSKKLAETAKDMSQSLAKSTAEGYLDSLILTMCKDNQDAQAAGGIGVFSIKGELARLICVPVPALCIRYFLSSEGWPLGRFSAIRGFREACKTAFTTEVALWHRLLGGFGVAIQTEVKDAASLRQSIFGYAENSGIYTTPAKTQEDWNKAFFFWLDKIRTSMDGPADAKGKRKGGRGRICPVAIVVDSMSAVLGEATYDSIVEEGTAAMRPPLDVKRLADFFRVAAKELAEYPISLLTVNHLHNAVKVNQYAEGPDKYFSGGVMPQHQMTLEIDIKRLRGGQMPKQHFKHGDTEYIGLRFEMMKNSLGAHRQFDATMRWYFDFEDRDPRTNEPRQHTYFDWHTATVELLLDLQEGDPKRNFSSSRARRLYEFLELEGDSSTGKAWSKPVGVSQKSPLSFEEMGLALEEKISSDPEFTAELYGLVGIPRRFMFQRGIDYREQWAGNMAELTASSNAVLEQLAAPIVAETVVELPPEL